MLHYLWVRFQIRSVDYLERKFWSIANIFLSMEYGAAYSRFLIVYGTVPELFSVFVPKIEIPGTI
jgi:hypothetical protein